MTFHLCDSSYDQRASRATLYHNSNVLNESLFKCTRKWYTVASNTTHGKAGETPLPAPNLSDVPFFREWHHHCPGHWGILLPHPFSWFLRPSAIQQKSQPYIWLKIFPVATWKKRKKWNFDIFRWVWPKSKCNQCKKLRCFTFSGVLFRSSVCILHGQPILIWTSRISCVHESHWLPHGAVQP